MPSGISPASSPDSFLDWLPQAFRGTYPAGNLSWHHLWFVAYVLVLTFVLLPCFLWARTESGRAAQSAAARIMGRFGLHWLMALPLGASILWLAPLSKNPNGLIGDWHGLVYYGVLLLYGGFIFGTPEMLAALNRQRFLSLGIGIAAYATLYAAFFDGAVTRGRAAGGSSCLCPPVGDQHHGLAVHGIGFANRYLTMRPRFLASASEAVYPFYMIHQTVTVIAVYWLLTDDVPPVWGFLLAALATFGVTWAIYAWLVQPVAFLRPLFGLKASRSPLLAEPAH